MAHFEDIDLLDLQALVAPYRGRPEMLLQALQDVQGVFTGLPMAALHVVSRELGLPLSRVFHVATFYSALSLVPRGRHLVKICMGTACHLRGASKVVGDVCGSLGIRQGDVTPDGEYGVETVNCLGACALAPVLMVDERYVGKVRIKDIEGLFGDRKIQPAAGSGGSASEPAIPGDTGATGGGKPLVDSANREGKDASNS